MGDYLPPVALKLTSEFDPKGIIEAERAVAALSARTERELRDAGSRSGRAFGDALPPAIRPGLDRFQREVRDAGGKGGAGLMVEFSKSIGRAGPGTLGGFAKDLDRMFQEAGDKGGRSLLDGFDKVVGGSGGFGRVVGDSMKLSAKPGIQIVDNFLSVIGGKIESLMKSLGVKAGDVFSKGFTSGLGEIAVAASPVLAPMAVALVAELGADMGGAMEGGIGLGGIFTGALIQLKTNSDVKAAATDFTGWLMGQLTSGSASFAEPMKASFADLKAELRPVMAELGKDFDYLAPYVERFATYLGAAAEKFMPGFSRAVQSSGPILTELGRGLVYVADGLSTMFDEIGKGGKGEVEALDTLFRVLGMTLAGTGFVIRGLSNTFDGFVQVTHTAVDWLDKLVGGWTAAWIPLRALGLKDYIDGISRSFDGGDASASLMNAQLRDLTTTADSLSDAVHKVSTAFDEYFNKQMGVDQATNKYKEDLLSLNSSLDASSRSLSDNSLAGLHNQDVILQLVKDAQDARQAQIDMAGGTNASKEAIDRANAAYKAATDQIIQMGVKAGLSKSQIEALVGQYNIDVVYTTTYRTRGTPPRSPDYSSIPTGRIGGERWGGAYIHAATGYLRDAQVFAPLNPGRYMIAEPETGGEAFVPRRGDYQRSMGILETAAAWYGAQVVPAAQSGPPPAILSALSTTPSGAARSGISTQPGNSGDRPIVVKANLYLDGWQIHTALIPVAQQYKMRSGFTGLS